MASEVQGPKAQAKESFAFTTDFRGEIRVPDPETGEESVYLVARYKEEDRADLTRFFHEKMGDSFISLLIPENEHLLNGSKAYSWPAINVIRNPKGNLVGIVSLTGGAPGLGFFATTDLIKDLSLKINSYVWKWLLKSFVPYLYQNQIKLPLIANDGNLSDEKPLDRLRMFAFVREEDRSTNELLHQCGFFNKMEEEDHRVSWCIDARDLLSNPPKSRHQFDISPMLMVPVSMNSDRKELFIIKPIQKEDREPLIRFFEEKRDSDKRSFDQFNSEGVESPSFQSVEMITQDVEYNIQRPQDELCSFVVRNTRGTVSGFLEINLLPGEVHIWPSIENKVLKLHVWKWLIKKLLPALIANNQIIDVSHDEVIGFAYLKNAHLFALTSILEREINQLFQEKGFTILEQNESSIKWRITIGTLSRD